MKELKFKRIFSDPCVYIRGLGDDNVILSVFVDDLLIFSRKEALIERFKSEFNDKFEIEDLGECKKIIEIEVDQRHDCSIAIHQRRFIADLLRPYKLENSNFTRTPLNLAIELCCGKESWENCELVDEREYRGIMGRLSYLARSSRPDIASTVSSLSRFNNKPNIRHMK